jgi:hypothetical protein
MHRIRCLDWSMTASDFPAFCNRMLDDVYNDKRGSGFIVEHRTHSSVRGRFVRRFTVEQSTVDPEGNVQRFDRIEYETVEFAASVDPSGIELINPPRSIKAFLMRVSQLARHTVAVADLRVDVASGVHALSSVFQKVVVRGLRFSGVVLARGVEATVVVSGSGDLVSRASDELLGERPKELDGAELVCARDDVQIRLRLASTGSAWFSRSPEDEVRAGVIAAMRASRRAAS